MRALLENDTFVISMGKKSGRRARRRENSGRFFHFFLSNGMSICVLPGVGSGRIVVHSEQHTLQYTLQQLYSTIEHATNILSVSEISRAVQPGGCLFV